MPAADRTGFTLLELLVGMALAAVIMAGAYSAYFSLQRAQDSTTVAMEQQRMLRASLDLMRRELSSLRFSKGQTTQRFLVEDRDIFGKPASVVSFATLAPPQEAAVSDQLLVQYRTSEADDGSLTLSRSSRDRFLATDTRSSYPLLERHEGFLVECFDGSTWRKNWDTDLTPALPQQIRVTVSVRDGARTVAQRLLVKPRISGS